MLSGRRVTAGMAIAFASLCLAPLVAQQAAKAPWI